MTEKSKKSSLFDDLYRLQNTAPELDVDPEDLIDGFRASLVEGVDKVETFGSSSLRRQAAIIPDDPMYIGKKASRKEIFSEDEDEDHFTGSGQEMQRSSSESEPEFSNDDDDANGDNDDNMDFDEDDEGEEQEDQADSGAGEESVESDDGLATDKDEQPEDKKTVDSVILPACKSDDREKGKAVMYQLGIWDDLIKSRISLQKMVTACNRLPQPETWEDFVEHDGFRKEAKNVHSSVRKLMSALLDLQQELMPVGDKPTNKSQEDGSDEEITSESENEHEVTQQKDNTSSPENRSHESREEEMDAKEEDDENNDDNDDDDEEEQENGAAEQNKHRGRLKRKLDVQDVEETLNNNHKAFQSFRNDTLSKWDEKTRLARDKVKSKNFAAFEVSVLKQIEQVLVNRERLVKRLHQQRSAYRILGQPSNEVDDKTGEDNVIDDDDIDIELRMKQRTRQEAVVNQEIIDDNDFYHVCLRDLIEMKQNEETDPVMANKQWLEIQRLRNKQKRKVDTRASKGRKIRYNVKEKLKNFMAPYDKSLWSDEQKDDLFKGLFGGSQFQDCIEPEQLTINLGI